jgi:hypothetical protein
MKQLQKNIERKYFIMVLELLSLEYSIKLKRQIYDKFRKELGFTMVTEMSDYLGINQGTFYRIIGKESVDNRITLTLGLIRLCKKLKIDIHLEDMDILFK